MAPEATLGVFFWIAIESKNQSGGLYGLRVVAVRSLFGVSMEFTGPVTRFAASDGVFMLGNPGMRRLAKLSEFGFVAGAAAIYAEVVSARANIDGNRGNR